MVVCLAMPVRAATEAQAVTSPGGIGAWLVQDDSIPLVTLNLYFPGGALLDPQGREGVTDMMVALMDDAAGDLDAAAYAATREGLPMRFSLGAGRNGISVSATILKRDLERCVAFLARTLSAPRFDEADIARLRPQLLSSLASSETEPGSIAGRAFRTRLFGDHPAGRPVEGTTETISAITRADILSAHDRAFDPGEVLASAVGDISAQELGEVLDRLVRGLDGETANAPGTPRLSPDGQIEVIPFDTSQSTAYFGHEGLARSDPDFLAAYVANFVLGGGSSLARLGEELRENRGLTYGVGTYLLGDDSGPLLIGSISTAHDRMAEALEVVRAEWARMAEAGVTEAELEEAKRYLIGSYALGFDSNGKIASTLTGLQRAGLPRSYMQQRNDLVAGLTVADVNRAAARLFRPDALTIVVVGQPEGLVTD